MSMSFVLLAALGCTQGLTPLAVTTPIDDTAPPTDTADTDVVTTTPGTTPPNQAPIADAGPDDRAVVADQVVLDGTGSSDPEAAPLLWAWGFVSKPAGSGSALSAETTANPSFWVDRPGEYVVELVVSDGFATATDEVVITATAPNSGPVANAGPDQVVDAGDTVQLNGSASYDPENDPLTYRWVMQSRPVGSAAVLLNDTLPLPQFQADVAGDYALVLVVSDGAEDSDPDGLTVQARAPSGGGGGSSGCSPYVPTPIGLGRSALGLLPLGLYARRRRVSR